MMDTVKQEAIIALDNSISAYGFVYDDEHENNLPVAFNVTAYDPLAEEPQQFQREPGPGPDPQTENQPQLTGTQPQMTVPQTHLPIPKPQVAPEVDERVNTTANVDHKDNAIERNSVDHSIDRENEGDASGKGAASVEGGDCNTNNNRNNANGNNNIVSWKRGVRTRTRKELSSYSDLYSDDIDHEEDIITT